MGKNIKNESYTELEKKMWITKGSRFNSYRRLKNQYTFSTYLISFLSFYIIVFSILPYFPSLVSRLFDKELTSFVLLTLSFFILILSLLESGRNYLLKAERLYNCANQISNEYVKLKSSKGKKLLNEITEKYHFILAGCNENHDPIDLELFQSEHYADFNLTSSQANWIKVKVFLISYIFYFIILLIVLLITFKLIV